MKSPTARTAASKRLLDLLIVTPLALARPRWHSLWLR